MNDQMLTAILARLQRLERVMPQLRIGEVTDLDPLDVALGGADTSYEDVQAIGPLADGDQVAALVAGNDLLVLGALNRGIRAGSATLTWPGGSAFTSTLAQAHGLGKTPTAAFISGAAGATSYSVSTLTSTTISLLGRTVDGSSPVGGTTVTVYWLVFG